MTSKISEDFEIVSFHPKHLEIAVLREEEKQFFEKLDRAYEKIDDLAKRSLESVTLIYDGRIITCCGFVMVYPGVCELWQIPTVYAKAHPRFFSSTMKEFLETIAQSLKVHRMQTTAPANPLHDRWMSWLGFKSEGQMEQYPSPNESHKLWARVFSWA